MTSACFTGHRTLPKNIDDLDKRLYKFVEQSIICHGLTDFYTGGAVGWDKLAARTVLKLREIYPGIRLNLILPCRNDEQTAKWSEEQKSEFYRILSLADTVEYTSEHYYNGCMKVRNARLVELADCCFCFWDRSWQRSGTAQTVRMAQKKNITVINFFKA